MKNLKIWSSKEILNLKFLVLYSVLFLFFLIFANGFRIGYFILLDTSYILIVSSLFVSSIVFIYLLSNNIIDNNLDDGRKFLIGVVFPLWLIIFVFYIGSKEVSSQVYNSFDKEFIHSELSDGKITNFEAYFIINRHYEVLQEMKKI